MARVLAEADRGPRAGSARISVEGQFEITIALLRAAGLLDLERPAEAIWSWKRPDGRVAERVRASWRPDLMKLAIWRLDSIPKGTQDGLSLSDEPPAGAWIICIHHAGQRRGEPWSMVCPETGAFVRSLFLVDDQIGTREGLGLEYHKETRLEREHRKFHRLPRPELFKLDTVVERRSPSKPKPLKPRRGAKPRLDTRTGLEPWLSGRRAEHYDADLKELLQRLPDMRASAEHPLPPLPAGARNGVFEQAPSIELDVLQDMALITPGEINFVQLYWSKLSSEVRAMACFDLKKPRAIVALIDTFDGKSRTVQAIKLKARPQKGWAFICPASGMAVNGLSFRFGRWASRNAQRLVYASQRSERFHWHDQLGYRDVPTPSGRRRATDKP